MIIGSRPARLVEEARRRRYAHALLLDANVPWVDDGTRVLRERRIEHTLRLRRELELAGQPYSFLSGSFEHRVAEARREVARALR